MGISLGAFNSVLSTVAKRLTLLLALLLLAVLTDDADDGIVKAKEEGAATIARRAIDENLSIFD